MAYKPSDVEKALYDWVEAALSDSFSNIVIGYENSAGDFGSVPYVLIHLATNRGVGTAETSVVEVAPGVVETRIETQREGIVRITVVGSSSTVSAWDVSGRIEESIYDQRVRLIIEGAPMGADPAKQVAAIPVDKISDARDMAYLFPTSTETRVAQDFKFTAVVCTVSTEPVDCIEKVITTGTIDGITINTQSP